MIFEISIEGKSFGSMLRPDGFRSGEPQPRSGCAFFCPICCRIWAKVQAEGRECYPYSISCAEHPRFFHMPAGSIWLPWDHEWNSALPRAVLEREVSIHIANYEYWRSRGQWFD